MVLRRVRRVHGVEIAIQLYELAEAMLRQRLRREIPRMTRGAIEVEVRRWQHERPGARHGDGPGRVVTSPGRRRHSR